MGNAGARIRHALGLREGSPESGIDPGRLRVSLELPSNEAVRGAVEAGMGATAISASVAAASIENGLLCHVPLNLPQREFHVIGMIEEHIQRVAGDREAASLDLPR